MKFGAALLFLLSCAHTNNWPGDLSLLEFHKARTSDGWNIELVRYKLNGLPTGRPVLLCHGIAANARNLDPDVDHSMPRWLTSQGREAWVMSIRGTGGSDDSDEKLGRSKIITLDDYALRDLPAAISFIQEKTKSSQIDFVGHSMGGVIVYAALASGVKGLGAVATLATPLRLDFGSNTAVLLRDLTPKFVGSTFSFPTESVSKFSAPLSGLVPNDPLALLFYNPALTPASTWNAIATSGTADVAGGLAIQLSRMADGGRFESFDRTIDYRALMRHIQSPVLVVASRGDRVALIPSVRDGFDALGSDASPNEKKQWLVISRTNGAIGEYGHQDLMMATNAKIDVWPKVLEFFNRHQ